jgi:vacuolar-type H+-ATPase subunit F/Vma7
MQGCQELSVVALGDTYFVTALRAAGVEARPVGSVDEAERFIDDLVKEGTCKVIIVSERLAFKLERKRSELSRRRLHYPVFAVIPEMDGKVEERANKLYQLISQAVGARLKLGED